MKGKFITYYIEKSNKYDSIYSFDLDDNETIISAIPDGDGGLDVVVWVPDGT